MTFEELRENKDSLLEFQGGLYMFCGVRSYTDRRGNEHTQVKLLDNRTKNSTCIVRLGDIKLPASR